MRAAYFYITQDADISSQAVQRSLKTVVPISHFTQHEMRVKFVKVFSQAIKATPLRQFKSQDGAEDGSRVACSGKTLQFFVCFICFVVVLRVRCC